MARDNRQVSFDWGGGGKKPKEVDPRGKESKVDAREGPGDSIQPSVSPSQTTDNIESTRLSAY